MTLLDSPKAPSPAKGSTEDVLAALSNADRVLQQERAATGILRAWPWILGLIPAAFAIDVIFHLSDNARAAMLAGYVVFLAILAGRHAALAWIRQNPPEHTARVLEARDPHLGSKLINLLQLREQSLDPGLAPLTRRMAAQAVAEYAGEIRTGDLRRLAHTNAVQEERKRAMFGLLGLLAILGATYDITRTEVPRFLNPFGDHPPYSFTRLEITEPAADSARIVYGQGMLFTVRTSGHRPGDVFLSSYPVGHPDKVNTAPMFDKGERGFVQQIEGIKSDLIVFAHTKNQHAVSHQRRVSVILAPKLEKAWVKVSPPAYTGLGPEEHSLQFKSIKVLEGSVVQFRLRSNRPLREGLVEFPGSPQAVEPLILASSGENEVTGSFTPKESAQLRFSLIDRDGHPSDEKWDLTVNVTHDLPPEVRITNPTADSFVAMDYKVDVVAEASDDYGVKTLRIHQARNGQWVEPRTTNYSAITRNAREVVTLDFKQMDIESGDTFSFFAEAIDTAPNPHVARSSVVTLTVISTDDYNAYLRERLDMADIEAKYSALFNKLHDLTDEQRKLGQEVDALKQQMANAKDPASLAPKLDELLAKQNEVNSKLNKLADTMDTFVREKPLYDVEKDFQDVLQDKAKQIRESTEQNDDDSKQVAQDSTKQDGGRQLSKEMLSDFKKASDDQVQRLAGAEQQAREQVEKPLEDMSKMQEIMKDLNHIAELDRAQQTLEQQVKPYDRPGPLSREDQLALKDLAATQKAIGEELEAVEQKLWEDGKAAEEKFPKAAKSAKDIAQKMGDLRLQMLANQATDAMVNGHGDNGAQLASRLRTELDKLFSQGQSQTGQMSGELDQYLKLSRGGMGSSGANTFKQMMNCHKFGQGQGTSGMGQTGSGGSSGSSVMMGSNANVLGNETAVSQDSKMPSSKGMSQAKPLDQTKTPALDKGDVMQDVHPVDRDSGVIQGESSLEQYSDIVDKYFKAITKPASPAPNAKPGPSK